MSELENILKAGEQAAPTVIGVFGMMKGWFKSKQEAKPEAKPVTEPMAVVFDKRDAIIGLLLVAVICLAFALAIQSAKSPLIVRL
jgi:hypothetical protein